MQALAQRAKTKVTYASCTSEHVPENEVVAIAAFDGDLVEVLLFVVRSQVIAGAHHVGGGLAGILFEAMLHGEIVVVHGCHEPSPFSCCRFGDAEAVVYEGVDCSWDSK